MGGNFALGSVEISIIVTYHWKMASSFGPPCDLAWKPLHILQDSSHLSLPASVTTHIVAGIAVYIKCVYISWLSFYTLQFCIVLYMLFACVTDIIAYTITDFVNAQTMCASMFLSSCTSKVMSSMAESLNQKIMRLQERGPWGRWHGGSICIPNYFVNKK